MTLGPRFRRGRRHGNYIIMYHLLPRLYEAASKGTARSSGQDSPPVP
jgi:hypothetical protein